MSSARQSDDDGPPTGLKADRCTVPYCTVLHYTSQFAVKSRLLLPSDGCRPASQPTSWLVQAHRDSLPAATKLSPEGELSVVRGPVVVCVFAGALTGASRSHRDKLPVGLAQAE